MAALGLLKNKGLKDNSSVGTPTPAGPVDGDVLQLRNSLRGASLQLLIESLDDSSPKVRLQAAAALGEAGSNAKHAIPKLIGRLNDPETRVRFFAAQSLGNIGLLPEQSAPALLRLIVREHDYTENNPSYAAVRSLIKLGLLHPNIIIPFLVSELNSSSEFMQQGVEESLVKIGQREQLLLHRYLERASRTENRRLREHAIALSERIAALIPDELAIQAKVGLK